MKKLIIKILKITGITVLLFSLSVWLFLSFAPTFGGSPSGESLAKIKVSKNFDGEKFMNSIATKLDTRDQQSSESIVTVIYNFIFPEDGKNPLITLPSAKFKSSALINNSFVWLGHSTILMQTDSLIILTDPVFNNASPIPGTVKPFEIEYPIKITDLPEKIDVVLISHDHYDHLDYNAIQELDERVSQYFVPLGIKAHLLKWGISEEKIKEKDWYDIIYLKNTSFTMTPARHFSGRGLNNRFSTLWCSWVIKSLDLNVFFNGDSGYFDEFRIIGDKLGPFDIAFMENGAYDKDWAEIHMLPEESVQANIDLKSELMFPIHWGKFDLANHTWNEPIIRASKETALKNVKIATPLIGEVFTVKNAPYFKWWN
jgi:L-ascorbate metabolism protein UlaG (beta-lactamase superfamily)